MVSYRIVSQPSRVLGSGWSAGSIVSGDSTLEHPREHLENIVMPPLYPSSRLLFLTVRDLALATQRMSGELELLNKSDYIRKISLALQKIQLPWEQ